ncbi:hypothetical protein MMC14_007774 [Varicellaria rhodocarpa]|nr:hypothetical protein [Varicellaria rhodocarpa]
MDLYQENTKDTSKLKFSIRGKFTWDQVMKEAELAQAKYIADGKGIRKVFRMVSNLTPGLDPWLKLLPNGDYTSVAAARHKGKRQEILETLEDLPKTLAKVEEYQHSFPQDLVLDDRAIELCLILLGVTESVIRWLLDKAVWKRVKDAFFGEFTTSSLEENCKCLRAKMHEIQDQVDSLQRNTILDMHSTTHRLETGVAKMNLVQTSTLSEIKAVSSTSHSIATGINEINASQDKFHSEYTAKLNGIKAGVDAQNVLDQCPVWVPIPSVWCADLYHVGTYIALQNGLANMLEEQLQKVDWLNFELKRKNSEIRKLRLETARKPRSSKLNVTCSELLVYLEADTDSPSGDLELVYRHGASLELSSYGQAQWIFQHGEFQDWFATDASQVLLVEGNVSAHALERISPTSHLCAVLLHTLKHVPCQASIHFFCGLHTGGDRPFLGVRGLLRSLITQLINLYDLSLDFIRSQKILDDIKTHEPDHLFTLFRNMVKRLPADM